MTPGRFQRKANYSNQLCRLRNNLTPKMAQRWYALMASFGIRAHACGLDKGPSKSMKSIENIFNAQSLFGTKRVKLLCISRKFAEITFQVYWLSKHTESKKQKWHMCCIFRLGVFRQASQTLSMWVSYIHAQHNYSLQRKRKNTHLQWAFMPWNNNNMSASITIHVGTIGGFWSVCRRSKWPTFSFSVADPRCDGHV